MPNFAQQTQGRMLSVYKDLIEHFRSNTPLDVTVKELFVRAEILKRDFTKRQVNLIFMIFTFSFAYGKESALIPKLQDMEMCGVSKTLVKNELEKLVDMNVITWEKNELDENIFSINNPILWTAPYHSGYNDLRSQQLFLKNLEHANIDITGILKALK